MSSAQVYACRAAERQAVPDAAATWPTLDIVAPTLIEFAGETLQAKSLAAIAEGDLWTIALHEPDIGEDLRDVGSQARRQGDTWLISGKKIWCAHGKLASHALLLVRTGSVEEREQGLTCFAVPLNSPGVEVLPIPLGSGRGDFDEIILKNVEVPSWCMIGALGQGWRVTERSRTYLASQPEFEARRALKALQTKLSLAGEDALVLATADSLIERFTVGDAAASDDAFALDRLVGNLLARAQMEEIGRIADEAGLFFDVDGLRFGALLNETRLEWRPAHSIKQELGRRILASARRNGEIRK
ncbi:acyl-CoA dehydrogenase family protein [Hyphomonas sp.]|uniref:acyl-CoA dehydrogenase family protein n=1 Tax=Hyphomonas sp. TaxID=87 RepID=UPI00352805BE